MPTPKKTGAVEQRSSMESFLDDYQIVRLTLLAGGLVVLALQVFFTGWEDPILPILPTTVAILVAGAHAAWCRARSIRTPRVMIGLDLTLFGFLMVLVPEQLAIATAALAFLSLVAVMFSDGWWTGGFLVYIASWYGTAYFIGTGLDVAAVSSLLPILLIVAGVALLMWRVKGWLSRLDANRSQMLGTVSHELKNNLTGMIGMTELVTTEQLAPQDAGELIGLAHLQALDANDIVDDLLTSTRLERSALSVDLVPTDLNEQVVTSARRFGGEGMTISLDLADGLPSAEGDSLRVRQVLRNLLSNAGRYGGPNVGVRTIEDGAWLRIVVSDDGDGVPPEDERTIFLPYRRSMATPRAAMAVGLGLWISRQLALAMGGTLEYRKLNGLTEFVFSLRKHEGDDLSLAASPATVGDAKKSTASLRELVGRSSIVERGATGLAVHA